jgi:glutamate synthase domain-containing protein 2/glutamate synthase domain-containing protein 1/glutamate synthase domain-containing protein 3
MDRSQAFVAQGHQSSISSSLALPLVAERSSPTVVGHASCPEYPLYTPQDEHDACGTGFVANISGIREHRILIYALEALANLAHRGAMDADAETSDGVGLMTQIPYRLLNAWLTEQGVPPVAWQSLAVGMLFLPWDDEAARQAREVLRGALERRGAAVLGWRVVPVKAEMLGAAARRACPRIEQVLVLRPDSAAPEEFERLLYLARKESEARLGAAGLTTAYIASLSARTLVYKGLLTAANLPHFYPDLLDPRFESALALFHQRYSTNTFPSWQLAQPMRLLAHNGEINTVQGNRNWMATREASSLVSHWGSEAEWLRPIIQPIGSDSTSLDNALELLVRSGRSLLDALTLLVPEAWEGHPHLPASIRRFFQARAPLMEPWDGPAALVFSDGTLAGAALDRNGLRPLRYVTTGDGLVVLGSEVGLVQLDEAQIVSKGRLGPGQVFAVDTARGLVLENRQIKEELASLHPYAAWVKRSLIPVMGPAQEEGEKGLAGERGPAEAERLSGKDSLEAAHCSVPKDLLEQQALFGYSHEDVELILRPMVQEGAETVWSMGDDTPLSIFSRQPRPLSSYFKQRFAQVTNPPIDSLREHLVMSLTTYLGPRGDVLAGGEPADMLLQLASPLLDEATLAAVLEAASEHQIGIRRIQTVYALDASSPDSEEAGQALRRALDCLEEQAVAAVQAGAGLLLLSDREVPPGSAPLPLPLALAAVHHALVRAGLRLRVGLVVETGAAWDVHQIALLIGYGANAVVPSLALATVRAQAGSRGLEGITPGEAERRYRHAVEKGVLKVMARMGLSVLESYLGAQLFECIGLSAELVERYFPGTPAALGGLTLADLDRQARAHRAEADRLGALRRAVPANGHAAPPVPPASVLTNTPPGTAAVQGRAHRLRLADRGYVRYRRDGEYHAANPQLVKALQQAVASGAPGDYRRYTSLVYSRPATSIRDLLAFRPCLSIPIEAVEPAEAIMRRFVSTAMSLGALSPEAHLTLTLGVNRVGARSNTGEGGEDPDWYTGTRDGISTNSRIKQVASGRFGVTASYLAHAEELEIKMAQGSKPGEGGQLPARKVTELIARLRHTAPGIPLISPPPHHDIYSIEDLAQLIYDLKQVNPRAAVGVKLVSERGVGTVAAGVAKAHADYILISGHDGGTGASPLNSIKNAGSPWELGLAEAQQVLRMNGLRGRVRLRTDGGLKTGRDVVVAAMLGADEFGFGTAALIALGCDMARQCHLDTCPTGIATQREDLRKRFTGTPEQVITFLRFLAEEVREILADLGARHLDDIIGRADMLAASTEGAAETGATSEASIKPLPALDLEALLASGPDGTPRRHTPAQQDAAAPGSAPLHEEALLNDALPLLMRGYSVLIHEHIHNSDRTTGARLAGQIARRWGDAGLPSGSITCHFTGSAGQSFGAFCVPGLRLILAGDANDYVGKGMTGGQIILMPQPHHRFSAREQIILGNTALYGATGGLLLAQGRAGERFAVRNSGAVAVVEGVGDHGCEYMTGGVVVVLGPTGRNFGAGMSGGVAYVYDEENQLPGLLNPDMVRLGRIANEGEAEDLAALLRCHAQMTGSDLAAVLLTVWQDVVASFWRVVPEAASGIDRPLEPVVSSVSPSPGLITSAALLGQAAFSQKMTG